jgi:hypothetical protein
LRPGVLMLGQSAIVAVLISLLGLPLGPWWAAAVLFVLMLGVPTMRVLVDLVMFRQVADEQRGRVMTAAFTLWGLGSSAGTFLIGVLLEISPVRNALLAVGAAVAAVFLAGLLNRDFRGTAWPAQNA